MHLFSDGIRSALDLVKGEEIGGYGRLEREIIVQGDTMHEEGHQLPMRKIAQHP